MRSANLRSSPWASNRLWAGRGSRLLSEMPGFTRHSIEIELFTRESM